jgi:hypothetical protein
LAIFLFTKGLAKAQIPRWVRRSAEMLLIIRFVSRQSEFAFFGAPASVGAPFYFIEMGETDMDSFIKQLWEGKLCASRLYQSGLNETERCAKLNYHINRLAPTLTDEQRDALEKMLQYYEQRENEAVEKAFVLGFSTGVSLTSEAFLKK